MLAVTVLAMTLALAPAPASAPADSTAPGAVAATQPRDCPSCGVYRGPNFSRVYDPYLLRVDIWPEFNAATCQFEVASHAFVTLGRGACAAERDYRAAMPRAAAAR